MASNSNTVAQRFGQLHLKRSDTVTLSLNRRIASGGDPFALSIAFSNYPIPIGQKFSVKILQKGSLAICKSDQCILQTSPIRHTLHGWRCCACSPLLPILCAKWPLVTIACHCCLLPPTARDYRHERTVCGNGHSVGRIRVRY